jgi:hypothetical protein
VQVPDAANAHDNAAGGDAVAVVAVAAPTTRPQPAHETRVFGWQEKVFSRAEVAAAQAAAREGAPAAAGGRVSPTRRAEHFGSQQHFGAEKLLVSAAVENPRVKHKQPQISVTVCAPRWSHPRTCPHASHQPASSPSEQA